MAKERHNILHAEACSANGTPHFRVGNLYAIYYILPSGICIMLDYMVFFGHEKNILDTSDDRGIGAYRLHGHMRRVRFSFRRSHNRLVRFYRGFFPRR